MSQVIYIGWDRREARVYDVARYSILRRTSSPKTTRIVPLQLDNLTNILTRPIEYRDGKMWCPISEAPMSTEFAISRFVVPFLQEKGWALFCDCDVLCQSDISELFALADPRYALMVVKHQLKPTEEVKMDGQTQTFYHRKNWSSVVLWNCQHPAHRQLTVDLLNQAPGRDLHAFCWLRNEEIGELPLMWNYLVGVNPYPAAPVGLLHYTLGGPWFPGWSGGPADKVWLLEAQEMGI